MGIIISGVRTIKSVFDQVLGMQGKFTAPALQADLEYFVNDCFAVLKPLSPQFKEVREIGELKLCIGDWLRVKNKYDVYGAVIKNAWSFFSTIQKHGDKLKPYVRATIKEDFAKLVDYTKQLESYRDIQVEIDIPEIELFEYQNNSSVKITSMVVNKIGINTYYPSDILLFRKDGKREVRSVFSGSNLCLFEDIMNYIVDLLKEALNKISTVKKHNDEIVKQMTLISEPWKITNRLKG